MNITDVRIKLIQDETINERLCGFCSITIDGSFVVRDLKIIDGRNGMFVAMPGRKLHDRCSGCGSKNHLCSRYCNQCGQRQDEHRAKVHDGRPRLHADIAHPINAACRSEIQGRVLDAYRREIELSRQPGYACRYDEFEPAWQGESHAESPGLAGRLRERRAGGLDVLSGPVRGEA